MNARPIYIISWELDFQKLSGDSLWICVSVTKGAGRKVAHQNKSLLFSQLSQSFLELIYVFQVDFLRLSKLVLVERGVSVR